MRLAVLAIGVTLLAPGALAKQDGSGMQEPTVALPPDLARVLDDYEAAWRSRDAAALASLFAEDGLVLPNGQPPVRGRAAIQQHYTGSGGPLALRAIAFATEGPVGYIIGGFARREGEADIGKFTLTLRRSSEGRWLIASDMDSPARTIHEGPSRDRADARHAGQPQRRGREAYPLRYVERKSREDARQGGQIRGRSRSLMNCPG